ncbi:hypothetical protein Ciccas_001002 [Cichlidogyrus casuarinus]|uniref:Uncharacterized protein n=1 Tax=Cichlidogyrus casuarinus TaxID=1844966 RepID=A0ABD2QLQ8_9PLAT
MHSLSWYLQVELQCAGCTSVNMTRTLDKTLNSASLKFPLIDSNGKPISIETLEWNLPIRLFPPMASAVHFPPEDTKASLVVVPDF